MTAVNTNDPIYVLVAEPLPIVRNGLVTLLSQITTVHVHAAQVSNPQTLRSLMAVRPFDFLFVSPNFGGSFDLQAFRLQYPKVTCIAIISSLHQMATAGTYGSSITIFDTEQRIAELLRKREPKEELSPDNVSPDVLSTREKEIVACLAKGMSNKEVAERLYLSVYTVMTHRRNICHKLHIHSVSGLTIYALANKLIDL